MSLMDGAIILDKPAGITSFAAVRKIRWLVGGKKVGHVGTLDPLGTGVLPMLVGRATRLARFYLRHKREYVARIRFGWATSTYDAEGEPVDRPRNVELRDSELEALLDGFRGTVHQVPPPVSAKKVKGVRAYKLARKRKPVALDPVEVTIDELELVDLAGPVATLRCLCSVGTYIRSLAHDLGQEIGCGAHVTELRRTLVGDFGIDGALSMDQLESMHDEDRIGEALLSPVDLLPEIPVQRVDAGVAARIRVGHDFRVNPFGQASDARLVKAVGPDGRLLCVGKAVSPRLFHPFLVFD